MATARRCRNTYRDYLRLEAESPLSQYKQCPSLDAVLIIPHRRKQVTVVQRAATTWSEREVRAGERVEVGTDIAFDVSDLYEVIEDLQTSTR